MGRAYALAVLVAAGLFSASCAPVHAGAASDNQRPEIAYLKLVNSWRPPSDPELVFLLMAQYANAGRHADGISFFTDVAKRFDPELTDVQRALYLDAIALLRAGHANAVPLLSRIGWVRETVRRLDEAKRLTHDEVFVTRWASGVVRAQLPGFLGERDAARADLEWCVTHFEGAPHPGWLREVYFQLAAIYRDRGDHTLAAQYLARSQWTSDTKPVTFTTPFASDPARGHTFSARAIREVVPHSVYALSGFDFTEFYFVISADRRELVAIDAGTSSAAARAALDALHAQVPDLPPLTTVLITHAHWDHVGGQEAFRSLSPAARFVGRANFAEELAHDAQGDRKMLARFFGTSYDAEPVAAYRPDVAIDRKVELSVGGTRFVLLPARGGETEDAMLAYLPEQRVAFVGDVLMPYLGAPFAEEGSVDGLLAVLEQLHELDARVLLHGHAPLTALFDSIPMLDDLHEQVAWLRDQVVDEVQRGETRAAIHAANLVPPELERSPSSVHLAYLVLRENVINRLFDQHSGYWQNGLQGLDALGDADRGELLVDYLGTSEAGVAGAAERLVADGKHEMAAELLRWAQTRFPASVRLQAVRRVVYLKLMEKNQDINPFKFIVYAGEIGAAPRRVEAPELARMEPSR